MSIEKNIVFGKYYPSTAHRAASPLTYMTKAFPPTVIFHGTADTTIPLENSERLFKQLREAQVPAEFHAFKGVPQVINPRTSPPFGGGGSGRGGR